MNMLNKFGISDVINTVNEIIVVLKIYEKKRLFRPLHTKIKFSIKYFLVNFLVYLVIFTALKRKFHFFCVVCFFCR